MGRIIVKYRKIILALAALLLIPAVIGFLNTKVNYDMLNYLPDSMDTVKGQKALLDEYTEAFAEIGFEIEPFGGREYKVSAVPYHLSMLGSRALFTEMLDHLETSHDPKKLSIYILRIATEACKAAVKGGDMLSLPEAEALIDELFLCEDPYHCPHGRPTIISFTEKELEKRFIDDLGNEP